MLLWLMLKSGLLWQVLDEEKVRFFFGWNSPLHLSRRRPLWRSIPWIPALFSPRRAREIHEWLRYRVELFDGKVG